MDRIRFYVTSFLAKVIWYSEESTYNPLLSARSSSDGSTRRSLDFQPWGERDLPKVSRGGDTAAKSGGEFSEQDSSPSRTCPRRGLRDRANARAFLIRGVRACSCVLAHERALALIPARVCLKSWRMTDRPICFSFLRAGIDIGACAQNVFSVSRCFKVFDSSYVKIFSAPTTRVLVADKAHCI